MDNKESDYLYKLIDSELISGYYFSSKYSDAFTKSKYYKTSAKHFLRAMIQVLFLPLFCRWWATGVLF